MPCGWPAPGRPIGHPGSGHPQGVIGVFYFQMPYERRTFDRKEWKEKLLTLKPYLPALEGLQLPRGPNPVLKDWKQ
jgi:hypothetical protein